MKRHFPGLAQAGQHEDELPEGEYLVEVKRIKYRWHPQKPFYSVRGPRPAGLSVARDIRAALLLGKGLVEAELVPEGLWL